MDTTTNLDLSNLLPTQAQKHAPVNEAIGRLDLLVHLTAQSRNVSAEPEESGDGESWILPADPIGPDWSGQTAGHIASFQDGVWTFIAPLNPRLKLSIAVLSLGWCAWSWRIHVIFVP